MTATKTRPHLCILSPHFVPANLTAVHRTRLWSQHIGEFGWTLSVVTTDSAYYEEPLDATLDNTLQPDIKIYPVKALPNKPVRWVGDIGIRSLPYYVGAIARLHKQHKIDFLHIAIPSNFASVVGRIMWHRFAIPYGIDYIDPWVHDSEQTRRIFSKAWLSNELGKILEPWAVKRASVISSVCREYYAGVLQRNPELKTRAVLAQMPYGLGERDYLDAAKLNDDGLLFRKSDRSVNVVYAGALLPHGRRLLREFLTALAQIKSRSPALYLRLRVHFIGTALVDRSVVLPIAHELGISDCVHETPGRMPYLYVLRHLMESDVCLVLGGSDKKYNPSKLFQTVASGNPVLVLLNQASPAVESIRHIKNCNLLTFTRDGAGLSRAIANNLIALVTSASVKLMCQPGSVRSRTRAKNTDTASLFTARDSCRALVAALDQARGRSRPDTGNVDSPSN